jgi:hypothetical protein
MHVRARAHTHTHTHHLIQCERLTHARDLTARVLVCPQSNKNAKEMSKRAKRGFVKALKRFELSENDDGTVPEGGISNDMSKTMQEKLSTERLREMMECKDKAELASHLAEEVEALKTGVARQAPTATEWSQEEQAALEKALKSVPKDAEDRWGEVAKLIPGRSKGEVILLVTLVSCHSSSHSPSVRISHKVDAATNLPAHSPNQPSSRTRGLEYSSTHTVSLVTHMQ